MYLKNSWIRNISEEKFSNYILGIHEMLHLEKLVIDKVENNIFF